ncbi:MAG: DNA-processing protein DprA [Blautia sp.]|nr:DNA-processing protein DprA [Blautia sp.]
MIRREISKEEICHITKDQELFPQKLLPYPGMPDELYFAGSLPDPSLPSAAIVGSRMCSPYGRIQAFSFAKVLSENGVQVISGMAAGIDSESHKGALEGKTPTFAVLGCGVDICYPKSSRPLRDRILRQKGGILSEFPPGSEPLNWHFPIRNRIISALADLILVVEARNKSGSLITASYALEQGKTVYAVPGPINDPLCQGTNRLIFDGAGVALSPDVLLSELGITGTDRTGKHNCKEDSRLDETAVRLLKLIGNGIADADSLAGQTGLSVQEISSCLMMLVMDGRLRQVDGCRYIRP